MSTNLEYRAIERQRKRESGLPKLNEKKSDRDLELEIKNRRRYLFVGRTT